MPATASEAPPTALYDQLYQLRRSKVGDHERPHKPALLLALIDLVESGHFSPSQPALDEAWRDRFRAYFEIVARADDKPNIHLPFYHLSSDGFWTLSPRQPGLRAQPAPRSFAQAQELYAGVRLSSELAAELTTPSGRARLRQALIARYFPDHTDELAKLAGSPSNLPAVAEEADAYGEEPKSPR